MALAREVLRHSKTVATWNQADLGDRIRVLSPYHQATSTIAPVKHYLPPGSVTQAHAQPRGRR